MMNKEYGMLYTNNYDGEYAYYIGKYEDVENIRNIIEKKMAKIYGKGTEQWAFKCGCIYSFNKDDFEKRITSEKYTWINHKEKMRFIDVTNNSIEVINA